MNRKQKIIVSITGIVVVMLALLGLTYGYYLTNIYGNTNSNSISVTTADLVLVYDDNNSYIDLTNIMPGTSASKTFTVSNPGTNDLSEYAVGIDEVTNTLTRTEDLTYSITCQEKKINDADTAYTKCAGTEDKNGNYPKVNSEILTNSIKSKYIQKYTITITYANPDEDQSVDMGSTIKGRMQIYSTADTIELTGSVANYTTGDFVQINSEPKTSQLIYNEETGLYEYKIIGVPIGEHTLSIRNGSTIKGSKPLTIKQGNNASFNNASGSLTITSTSEKVSVNLGSISNNTFDLTMSTPVDKDITPPTVDIVLSSEEPKAGETLTTQITHTDNSGINLNNSKWIINQVSTNINGVNGYTWNKFNKNPETIDITQTAEGTYYLHVVSEDLEGNIKEIIKEIIIESSIVISTFLVENQKCITPTVSEYEFEVGMTWQEWATSTYNSLGFLSPYNTVYINGDTSLDVLYTDYIISGNKYNVKYSGPC